MSAQTPRLGVIMLCHDNLDIVARQAQVWVNGGAAVVIHVDRKAPAAALAQLQEELAGLSSVSFSPRHHCEWGQFSLVRATLDAADMMLDRYPGVGHVFLASGSCLPLRPINDLNAYLKSQPDTDFIESVRATDVDWTIGGLGPERFEYYFPLFMAQAALAVRRPDRRSAGPGDQAADAQRDCAPYGITVVVPDGDDAGLHSGRSAPP